MKIGSARARFPCSTQSPVCSLVSATALQVGKKKKKKSLNAFIYSLENTVDPLVWPSFRRNVCVCLNLRQQPLRKADRTEHCWGLVWTRQCQEAKAGTSGCLVGRTAIMWPKCHRCHLERQNTHGGEEQGVLTRACTHSLSTLWSKSGNQTGFFSKLKCEVINTKFLQLQQSNRKKRKCTLMLIFHLLLASNRSLFLDSCSLCKQLSLHSSELGGQTHVSMFVVLRLA